MIEYPSIPRETFTGTYAYAFDKLDGQNIRAEWSRKKGGFTKFGTRTRLLGPDEPIVGQAIPLLRSKYEKDLNKICKKKGWQRVTFFFEFLGPNSFAGVHDPEDVFDVVLFDAAPKSQGELLDAKSFLKIFGSVDHAPLLYHGKIDADFVQSVHESTLEGMTFEGVICKGPRTKKNSHGMFKIKSEEWLEAIKDLKFDENT